jgi:hypothetical protein
MIIEEERWRTRDLDKTEWVSIARTTRPNLTGCNAEEEDAS